VPAGIKERDTLTTPTEPEVVIEQGSSKFTSQRPFIVTAKDLAIPWNGGKGMFCGLCDQQLQVGDRARWVYVAKAPNILVCSSCDGPDAAKRFGQRWVQVIVPILRRWGPSDYVVGSDS